jgi:hypothetical protein
MKGNFILTAAILFSCAATLHAAEGSAPATETAGRPAQAAGCQGCHEDVAMDADHRFACTLCHGGNDQAAAKKEAHRQLIHRPASPQNMARSCGQCHGQQVDNCGDSLHFTVKKAVSLTRNHFGLPPVDNLTQLPASGRPADKEQLVDDMLRRRCLRCHVYTAGDSYPYVRRGTGCAACHLQYTNGSLDRHEFIKPTRRQCLSCHYANHVGSDFIGRYEHDYNWEYRTPYTTKEPFARPYGVELHELAPDIHFQRGLTCRDCHSGSELAGTAARVTCRSCHDPAENQPPALPALQRSKGRLVLTDVNGKDHEVPRLRHPAHEKYSQRGACQVCHAQWSFNDRSTHLLLSYSEDVDPWDRLTVQSSSVVETFLEHNLYSIEDELEPAMPDSITGRMKPGIWFLGFTQRRWEEVPVRRDRDGIIKVFRPILDIRLSAVDEDEEVLFDNLTGRNDGMRPYTPHTTGPAGLFYEQRFLHLLDHDDPDSPPPATGHDR